MRISNKRIQPKELVLVENSGVSEQDLARLSEDFDDDETSVHWADRQSIWSLLFRVFWVSLLILLLLALAAYMNREIGVIEHKTHGFDGTPVRTIKLKFTQYLWWIPLVLALVLMLYPLKRYVDWRVVVRLMTNKKVRVHIRPPRWAIWLWNNQESDPQPLTSIVRVIPRGTILGRFLGYGTLRVVTLLQEDGQDKELHDVWRYVRSYREVAAEITNLVDEVKEEAAERAKEANRTLERIEQNGAATLSVLNDINSKLPNPTPGNGDS